MRGLYKFLSYLSVFNLGAYVFASFNGFTVEWYRWALTIFFGWLFYNKANENYDEIIEE